MRPLAAILLLLLLAILSGCKTRTELVYVPSVTHDTLRLVQTDHRIDSVHDSTYVTQLVYSQADTVYVATTTYRDRLKYRDRLLRDTIYRAHTDTITKVVAQPAALTGWQKMQQTLGRIFLAVIVGAAGIGAAWVWYRKK